MTTVVGKKTQIVPSQGRTHRIWPKGAEDVHESLHPMPGLCFQHQQPGRLLRHANLCTYLQTALNKKPGPGVIKDQLKNQLLPSGMNLSPPAPTTFKPPT